MQPHIYHEFCYTNHSLTMVFVVKLWIQKKKKKLHYYYNKTMVNFLKGCETMLFLTTFNNVSESCRNFHVVCLSERKLKMVNCEASMYSIRRHLNANRLLITCCRLLVQSFLLHTAFLSWEKHALLTHFCRYCRILRILCCIILHRLRL